jgi:hypothetical protein
MSDEYYVKLTGKLMEGRSPDLAAQFLSDNFHIPWETGRTYFNGAPTVLKKKLDLDTAEKVCHRLRNTGAECEIEQAPDLGFTLELVDDGPEPSSPAPASPPTRAQAQTQAQAQAQTQLQAAPLEDDFSLELIENADAPLEQLHRAVDASDPSQGLEPLESLEPLDSSLELGGLELELHADPAPQLQVESAPSREMPPPPPPAAAAPKTDSSTDAATGANSGVEEDKSEQVDIGDVTAEVGQGGGVGGMLPQASTAPSFKRPGLSRGEEARAERNKKLLLPIAAGGLLALAAGGYFLLSPEPAPPPAPQVAPRQAPAKAEPVEVDNSMIIALQINEGKAKLDSLYGSISEWRATFSRSAAQIDSAEQLKTALKTDMGISETDWLDPWGSQIEVRIAPTGIGLISAGPDQTMGSSDDLQKGATESTAPAQE